MLMAAMLSLMVAVLFFAGPVAFFVGALLTRHASHYTADPIRDHDRYIADVLALVRRARKTIWLVRGEVRTEVYDQQVADALKEAIDRGVEVFLACGPWVNVTDQDKNPLLDLADRALIRLYYRDREHQPACHFAYADDGDELFWEAPHFPDSGAREVWLLRRHDLVSAKWRGYLDRQVQGGRLVPVGSSQEKHVRLTGAQEVALRNAHGSKFYSMTGGDKEISALAKCLG